MQPPYNPQPPGPQPKKNRGCLIAIMVAVGVVLLGAVAVGIGAYLVASSPEGKKALEAAREGAQTMKEGMNAPGTKELRVLGCDTAMIMDIDRMEALARRFVDGGPSTSPARRAVICNVQGPSGGPTCAEASAAYRAAAGAAAARHLVQVNRRNGNEKVCHQLYDADGTDLGAVK